MVKPKDEFHLVIYGDKKFKSCNSISSLTATATATATSLPPPIFVMEKLLIFSQQ